MKYIKIIINIVILILSSSIILADLTNISQDNIDSNVTTSQFGNIVLTIPQGFEKINPGNQLLLDIKLLNLGSEKRIDVILDFIIKDPNETVILKKKETIAVETQVNLVRTFVIPKDAQTGKYTIVTKLLYPDGRETLAETSFDVIMENLPKPNNNNAVYIVITVVVVLLLILIYIGIKSRNIIEKIRLNMQIRRIVKDRLKSK